MSTPSVLSEGGSWAMHEQPAFDLYSEALLVLEKEANRRWRAGEQALTALGPRLQRVKALREDDKRIGESHAADVELVVYVLAAILGALDADPSLLQNLSDLLYRSLHHCSPCVADAEPACSVDPANIVGGATDTAPCAGAVGAREHAAPTESSASLGGAESKVEP